MELPRQEPAGEAAAHYNLALSHTRCGRVDRAEREYRRALAIDPDLVEAWVNLGGVRLLKWDFQGSLEANREALARRPDLVQAHFNAGQAALYLGDAEELVSRNRRVLELDPDHAAGHYFLAVGLLATGRVREARAVASRAVALGYRPRPDFLRALERAESRLEAGSVTDSVHAAPAQADSKEE